MTPNDVEKLFRIPIRAELFPWLQINALNKKSNSLSQIKRQQTRFVLLPGRKRGFVTCTRHVFTGITSDKM